MKFVDEKLARKIIDLGFDEPCWAWFHTQEEDVRYCYSEEQSPWKPSQVGKGVDNIIPLPTVEQVLDWLLKDKQVYIADDLDWGREHKPYWNAEAFFIGARTKHYITSTAGNGPRFETREEAVLGCIIKLFESQYDVDNYIIKGKRP